MNVAYKLTNNKDILFLTETDYTAIGESYLSRGYQVEEVAELPPHERIMQRIDGEGVYTFTTNDTVRQLRGNGNITVGQITKINTGVKDIHFKAVEVNGVRVLWERVEAPKLAEV